MERRPAATSSISSAEDPVRVIRVDYGGCMVDVTGGPRFARAHGPVAVGDWVLLSDDEPHVEAIIERTSQLTRRDSSGLLQVLAANVDLVFITVPADRMSLNRAEREVTLAWDSGAVPVVLLTKADLDDGTSLEALRDRILGVDIIEVSTLTGRGLDTVRSRLVSGGEDHADNPGRTAVLLGPSGAGKSSLVNALLGSEAATVQEVRAEDHRGRHTTTARELHVVPSGGFLIDTPGLRSLSLAVGDDALEAAFPDIYELAAGCRFRDCAHAHEPDCAVITAAESGELDLARLDNYHRLLRDLDYQLRRDDPVAAQANKALWRQRSMDIRRLQRERGH